jgi:hypothetical protein
MFLNLVYDASNVDWHQWLTPVILTTQKAEVKRITVPGNPRGTKSS